VGTSIVHVEFSNLQIFEFSNLADPDIHPRGSNPQIFKSSNLQILNPFQKSLITPSQIDWLLEGDISIRFQTQRDLLDNYDIDLQKKIQTEGWVRQLMDLRQQNGHWGHGFYQPKWTSTHYTLLELKNMAIYPDNEQIRETLELIFRFEKEKDGGINPSGSVKRSDVCINGMVLNYACWFRMQQIDLESVVDFLLSQQMADGGFNCHSNRIGATHSSLHTTLSVLEGILEYERNGYQYRLDELKKAGISSREFIMMHRFFRSDRTGEVIHPKFLRLVHPCRWYYDILRALDYFQSGDFPYDERMEEALKILMEKQTKDGTWKLAASYPGKTHFQMEKAGLPSRWNTLRALRVVKRYQNSAFVC